MESGEWRVESGEWRVESGEWRVDSSGDERKTDMRSNSEVQMDLPYVLYWYARVRSVELKFCS